MTRQTIELCLELINGLTVPVTAPGALEKLGLVLAARAELLAALEAAGEASPVVPSGAPG